MRIKKINFLIIILCFGVIFQSCQKQKNTKPNQQLYSDMYVVEIEGTLSSGIPFLWKNETRIELSCIKYNMAKAYDLSVK